MVNYTALNETDNAGGSECVYNTSDNGDVETDAVIIYYLFRPLVL